MAEPVPLGVQNFTEYTSPTFTRTVRGAHIDVLDKLENIVFVEGTNGGMSSEVAYIRYWSRKGVTEKASVVYEEGRFLEQGLDFPANAQELWSFEGSNSQLNAWSPTTPSYDGPFGSIPWEEVNPPSSGVSIPPTPKFIPLRGTESLPENTYRYKPPSATEYAKPTTLQRILFGRAFSANPTGTTLTAEPSAPIEGTGIWQFMFNPEEIQLESGPEYNRAETWGVSEANNSGQPLSWRNNRNRKLTFSKVILHGYTFGKRVEQLEKGLQDLFMARDGENGADGPPVLEFVWGRRKFGPCVIQNIRVREQAWDKGILVNAEVSFELEQVPEWTINDGFVDIARPARQPLVNDPTLPARAAAEAAAPGSTGEIGGSGEEPKDKPGGGGGRSATDNAGSYRACQKAFEFVEIFRQIKDTPITINLFDLYDMADAKNQFDRIRNKFKTSYNQAVSSVGSNFTKRVPGNYRPEAIDTQFLSERIDQMSNVDRHKKYFEYVRRYKEAARICSDAMGNVWNNDCAKLIEAGKKAQTAAENSNNREYLCANVRDNKKCTIPVGNTIKNPCNGKYYLCQANRTYKSI